MKKIHLLANAHIDPVWQWEWEEGAAAAVSTFRCAADFCEEYDGFVFCHNEAELYEWIEEYEPELFSRIRKLVKEGRWHIMGGWYLQPDCNLPSGEGIIRSVIYGRNYFSEKFGSVPRTAINFDPFGHSRGLVQILSKCGFDSYLFMRPYEEFLHLPEGPFKWIGFDGSELVAQRTGSYNTLLGRAAEKIRFCADGCADGGVSICLWGVGDHGGGPSRKDLDDISRLISEYSRKNVEIIHSTPENYFDEVRERGVELPEYRSDLNPWAVGCYTSQIRIKQKYRRLESEILVAERMCSAALARGLLDYPENEIKEAVCDMLKSQFHDILPGSSVKPAEESSLRTIYHGLEIISRIKARAFFAMSGGQQAARPDRIPVMIFNPMPYSVEAECECEMMLWDQNWDGDFSFPTVFKGDEPLPTQCEKEASTINLDWRKKVVFRAKLDPLCMNRFDVEFRRIPEKPVPKDQEGDSYIFENGEIRVVIDKQSGLIKEINADGTDFVAPGAFSLDVYDDDSDPWGMNVVSFTDRIGAFSLLAPSEGTRYSGITSKEIPSFRVIEDGDVRTKIECLFGYRDSRAVVTYSLPKKGREIGISVHVNWNEKQKLLKMNIPTAFGNADYFGETMYGEQELTKGGRENSSQRYIIAEGGEYGLSISNDGVYGSSCTDGELNVTLLRSPVYTAHPILDRERIPQDRFNHHIDQGEREYSFVVTVGKIDEVRKATPRIAALLNERPMSLSFYPPAHGIKSATPICIEGDVQMPVFKRAEDGNGFIIRLFNSSSEIRNCVIKSYLLDSEQTETLHPWEIRTLRIAGGKITDSKIDEREK